ncbi:hypothetical protein [Mesorhizobium sp. M0254]|uniref:virion core protein, T7 gp14 family n=1 Tax=Mesorhizobium sp. M0254 TaxID=2956927 RepID=UPI003334FA99
MALTIGSTLLGAAGSIQQAQATSAANKYNAQVQDMNAKLSERRAKDAIDRGAKEDQRKRQQVAGIQGQQRAAMAANGVDLTFGSPLDTLVDTAVMGELDALTIRTNANREAYDYKVDAVNKRAGATMSRMSAKAATTGGYLDALGTVLGGAGKAYKDYKTPGGLY